MLISLKLIGTLQDDLDGGSRGEVRRDIGARLVVMLISLKLIGTLRDDLDGGSRGAVRRDIGT
jgi:hypothetical protein